MSRGYVFITGGGLEMRGDVVFRAAALGAPELIIVGQANVMEEFKKRFGIPRHKELGPMKITFEKLEE